MIHLDNKCPNCRKEPYMPRNLSIMEKNMMNALEIRCPLNCEEKLSYENYNKHFNYCKNYVKKFLCNNCHSVIIKKIDSDELFLHKISCEKTCEFCKLKFSLMVFERHETECYDRIVKKIKIFIDFLEASVGFFMKDKFKKSFERFLSENKN